MPILHWIGKDKVLNHHLIVPTKTLKASPSPSEGGELKCVTSKGEEPKWIPSEVGHSCSSKGRAYSSSPPLEGLGEASLLQSPFFQKWFYRRILPTEFPVNVHSLSSTRFGKQFPESGSQFRIE